MKENQNNKVIQLCAKGMEMEGHGQFAEAGNHFNEAWKIAITDAEKSTAAHYVARLQKNISDKLEWDKIALQHALLAEDEKIKEILPSLYLNVGKCYEDLHDFDNAKSNYEAAFSFIGFLPQSGYGNMIKSGINKGLERVE